MRPEPLRGDERALEMRTEDARRRAVLRHLAQRRRQLVLRRGDEGRLVRGHAALAQCRARAAIAVRVGGEEVNAREAVHLQVDEAGGRDTRSGSSVQPDGRDPSVHDLDVPGQKLPVDERCLDAQPPRMRHR